MVDLAKVTGVERDHRTYQPSGTFVLPYCKVGLELEIERVPEEVWRGDIPDQVSKYWRIKEEGSLRNGGLEYVLNPPLFGMDLDTGISNLCEHIAMNQLADSNSFSSSSRTSFHVHIDVSDLETTEQLYTFFALYLIVERSLFRYFNDEREDNIFCLPFYRTWESAKIFRHLMGEDPMEIQRKFNAMGGRLRPGRFNPDRPENQNLYKYSAFNANPVFSQGSVEFRHAPALTKYDDIVEWINIIMCLKKAAFERPLSNSQIGQELSFNGVHQFYRDIFGLELTDKLVTQDTHMDAIQGVRLGQQVENDMHKDDFLQAKQDYIRAHRGAQDEHNINPIYVK